MKIYELMLCFCTTVDLFLRGSCVHKKIDWIGLADCLKIEKGINHYLLSDVFRTHVNRKINT